VARPPAEYPRRDESRQRDLASTYRSARRVTARARRRLVQLRWDAAQVWLRLRPHDDVPDGGAGAPREALIATTGVDSRRLLRRQARRREIARGRLVLAVTLAVPLLVGGIWYTLVPDPRPITTVSDEGTGGDVESPSDGPRTVTRPTSASTSVGKPRPRVTTTSGSAAGREGSSATAAPARRTTGPVSTEGKAHSPSVTGTRGAPASGSTRDTGGGDEDASTSSSSRSSRSSTTSSSSTSSSSTSSTSSTSKTRPRRPDPAHTLTTTEWPWPSWPGEDGSPRTRPDDERPSTSWPEPDPQDDGW
jgi:hypothetical protein